MNLNLGCGSQYLDGFVNVDRDPRVITDLCLDLNALPWPWHDNEASYILMDQVLEHLPDTIAILKEVHRVLMEGGMAVIKVPHCQSTCAFRDPTHVRFFDERSLDYFTASHPRHSYCTVTFRYVSAKLTSMSDTPLLKLRNLIPFRRSVLRHFCWNMVDGITFTLLK